MGKERSEKLSRIAIRGFKSIKECDLDLNNVNVLIGANGAGKSNFISIFEMLQMILSRELALYSGKKGISPLLYNGKEVTDSISAEFHFGSLQYSYELEWTENDSFLFREESLNFNGKELLGDGGHKESNAQNTLRKNETHAEIPKIMLNPSWRVYQFHDTSPSSRTKSESNISNSVSLMNDARNLAAFLYRLKQFFQIEYSDILHAIQMVAPFFDDFVLEPKELNEEQIILKWKKKGCEDVFNAAQFSDGTLRFICLATLLLQPTELQPSTIIIDEPELGLHPFAITILAEMVQKAAVERQVFLASQSVELLDNFEVEDVIVANNGENGSEFIRLNKEQLRLWLDSDYTLSEL
jgi:predicted ATPase